MTTLQQSLQIIEQRWPNIASKLTSKTQDDIHFEAIENTLVANGVQLTTNYDPAKEAQLQIQHISATEKEVTVYGPALGDSIRELLSRKNIDVLHVVILNTSLFLNLLNYSDQLFWLNDSRVSLDLAINQTKIAKLYTVSPAELVLAEVSAWPFRDRLELAINNEYAQSLHANKKELQDNLQKNNVFVEQDSGIDELTKKQYSQIVVVGAGPSLESSIELLKASNDVIIAVDAALPYLLSQNIVPQVIVSIDYTAFQFFKGIKNSKLDNSALVYFPSIDHNVLTHWQGKRFCSYSNTPLFLPYIAKHPKPILYSGGGVIHPSVDLAVKFGAKNIILYGVDFAFNEQQSHAGDQNANHILDASIATEQVIGFNGQPLPTMASLKNYLRDLESYIDKQSECSFYVASDNGAKIAGVSLWQV